MNETIRIALPSLVIISAFVCAPALASAQEEAKPPVTAAAAVDPGPATATDASEAPQAPEESTDANRLRPRFRLGAQANLVIPVGDYADIADVAIGGDLRFAWDLHPNVGITFRAGYLHHFGTPNDATMGFIPLMLGGEYRFFGDGSTPFIAAELGATIGFVSGTVSTPWGSAGGSDTDSAFALALGGGYRFGPVDIRAMLYAPDVDDLFGFAITLGGDFATF
jgi:hypothetical protein